MYIHYYLRLFVDAHTKMKELLGYLEVCSDIGNGETNWFVRHI